MLDLGNKKVENGFSFKVFAPNAKEVVLYTNGKETTMEMNDGYWTSTLDVPENTVYSYIIDGVRKADPFANKVVEIIKGQPESVTYHSSYTYQNDKVKKPLGNILEVYLKNIKGDTYQEKATEILKKAEGYSHIELMPFYYTPNKKTLGYKTSTYFAPEPKYGDLDDFKELIDTLHSAELGVILDFSIFEFEEFSKTGLQMFDGTALFERDNREQHKYFTGYFFDYEKPFVRNFLKHIVQFFINDLNIDGIRVDGVNELVFISDGKTQEINELGLAFVKEILSEIPEDLLFVADMLTHHTLEELGLERIDAVEGNMFMFQLQKILNRGEVWLNENKESEFKLLYETLILLQKNKIISTINHDLHINGIQGELPFGGVKNEQAFTLLKNLLYALPVSKQIYFDAELDEKFPKFIDGLSFDDFKFNIFENNIIQFIYRKENKGYHLDFHLFKNEINLTFLDTVKVL